jgi:hypothetical protein
MLTAKNFSAVARTRECIDVHSHVMTMAHGLTYSSAARDFSIHQSSFCNAQQHYLID